MEQIRFAHVTDLHIAPPGEYAYDIDVRENFEKIIESLQFHSDSFDFVVVTGDLCFREGTKEIYGWIIMQLEKLGKEYYFIPGNHDDVNNLVKIANIPPEYLVQNELFYEKDFGVGKALFLDTSSDFLSLQQMEWLEDKKYQDNNELFIFMHHPPVYSGIRYMDQNFALQNLEEVNSLLKSMRHNITVFSGHYHADKVIMENNLTVFITPSCFFQVNQTDTEFAIESYQVGWRLVTWNKRQIRSTVKFF